MCITETFAQDSQNVQLRLAYYQFPLSSPDQKPARTFVIKQPFLSIYQQPHILNNHSGLFWKNLGKVESKDVFYVFDLRSESKKMETYDLEHFFMNEKQMFSCEGKQLWQPKHGIIYAKYVLKLDYTKFLPKYKNENQ